MLTGGRVGGYSYSKDRTGCKARLPVRIGHMPVETKPVQINNMPVDLWDRVRRHANRHDRRVRGVVVLALRAYLRKHEVKE